MIVRHYQFSKEFNEKKLYDTNDNESFIIIDDWNKAYRG